MQMLHARPAEQNEWWYYHGYLTSGTYEFGFHLVFFRRSTAGMRVGRIIPVEKVTDHVYAVHFSLTDLVLRQFHYGQRRSLFRPEAAASDRYRVQIGGWSAEECDGSHRLHAGIRQGTLDLVVTPTRALNLHGQQGFFPRIDGECSYYCSYPRMLARGTLRRGRKVLDVTGSAWMDHEFGDFTFCPQFMGWTWFAIQLDDQRELTVWLLLDANDRRTAYSRGSLMTQDGQTQALSNDEIEVDAMGSWTSRWTGLNYATSWNLRVPGLGLEFDIQAAIEAAEFDARGTTGTIYWEGPASVTGRQGSTALSGRAYVEAVRYAHLQHLPGVFDFATNNIGFWSQLVNEVRLSTFGRGRTRISS